MDKKQEKERLQAELEIVRARVQKAKEDSEQAMETIAKSGGYGEYMRNKPAKENKILTEEDPDFESLDVWNKQNTKAATTEEKTEEQVVEKEIENLSLEDRKKVAIGINNIGFIIEKKKSDWFANTFDWISKKGDQKSIVSRFTRGLRDSFKADAEMAQKKVLAGKEAGTITNLSNVAYLAKNILRPLRLIADATGMSPAGVQRLVMLGSMASARITGAMKEARLANEEVVEKTRLDIDKATEEAWKIYKNAQRKAGRDGNVSADELKNAYLHEIPKDLQERLKNTTVADGMVQGVLRKHLEFDVNRLNEDIEKVEKNKKLSPEKINAKKKQLLRRWEKRLVDYDRVLTQTGTVDGFAMAARYAEASSKNVIRVMTAQTLYLTLDKIWDGLSHVLSSHDIHPVEATGKYIKNIFSKIDKGEIPANPPSTHDGVADLNKDAVDFKTSADANAMSALGDTDAPSIATPPSTPENIFVNEGIKFDHGKGGIQGIEDLKNQIEDQYNGDYSNAPKSVQDFMKESSVQQAIKLGFYDPKSVSGEESALIQEGSVLKFDEQGNILFGKPDTSGNIPALEKYHGAMFDSDHHTTIPSHDDVVEKAPDAPATEQPEQASNLEIAQEPAPEPEPAPAPKSITAEEAKEAVIRKMDAADDEGIRELYNSVRGLDNAHPEYILELSQKELDLLNRYPEFALNTEDLPVEKIMQVIELHQKNISHVFPEHTDNIWNTVKGISAEKAMSDKFSRDFSKDLDAEKIWSPFVKYLNELKNLSGLEPKNDIFNTAETNEYYIARALQKVVANGKVEELKASLAK